MLDVFLRVKKFLGRHGHGHFSSALHGSGIDIAENRAYAPGDEKRSINWKMSAKYDKLFINLFHDEKALDVHICCDVNYNRKGENTECFVWFFAGLTDYFQSKKAHISAFVGVQQFLQLEKPQYQKLFLDSLGDTIRPMIPRYQSSLYDLLYQESLLPKRRLIIVVSDFLSYDDKEKRLLNLLRERHEVKLVQIPIDDNSKHLPEALSLAYFQQ